MKERTSDDLAAHLFQLDPFLDPILMAALVNAFPQHVLETGRCRNRNCIKLHLFAHHYGRITLADLPPCPPTHHPGYEHIITVTRRAKATT